ncbi:MAG TPA: STN and carboxypeptidase regulatory-like domain-containing protein, partial [Chryseosolibacter sp.]
MLGGLNIRARDLASRVFFLVALCSATNVFGQRQLPQVRLTVQAEDASLSELLSIITAKSGISFSYNPKRIPVQQKTSYRTSDKTLDEILGELARQFGLTFEFVEDQIIVKPDRRSDKVAAQTFTLSGTVKDSGSGEVLIGASVYVRELQTGTVTN